MYRLLTEVGGNIVVGVAYNREASICYKQGKTTMSYIWIHITHKSYRMLLLPEVCFTLYITDSKQMKLYSTYSINI